MRYFFGEWRFSSFFGLSFISAILAMVIPPDLKGADGNNTAPEDINIDANRIELQAKEGWSRAIGNVKIRYRELTLTADEVRVNRQTKDVEADGNVELSRHAEDKENRFDWYCDKLTGNMEEKEFQCPGKFRFVSGDVYVVGEGAEYHSDGTIVFHDAGLATCDYIFQKPGRYHVMGKKVIYDKDKRNFLVYHSFYKAWIFPVMYLPVMYYDRDWDTDDIGVRLGHSDDLGWYALFTRQWKISDKLQTTFHFDAMSARGLGFGNETTYKTSDSRTEFLGYILPHDEEPPGAWGSPEDYNRRYRTVDTPYRFRLYHRQDFSDKLTLRVLLDKLSGIDMLEEWFESEYDNIRQPWSFVDLTYDTDKYSLSFRLRPRLNDFYTVVEKMPEFTFDVPRQPIGESSFYYRGYNSLARLERKWPDFARSGGAQLPEDYDAWRADSLHMFYRPFRFWDKYQFTPRAGARFTYYSDTSASDITTNDLTRSFHLVETDTTNVSGVGNAINYDEQGGSALRFAGELGFRIDTKYMNTWQEVRNDFLNLNGLRMVTQPYLNYTWIPEPSEDREDLYYFDRTDRLVEQNFMRVGVRERFQTRNESGDDIYTMAEVQTYADFHFDPQEERGHMGDISAEIGINPSQNWSFDGLIRGDLDEGQINKTKAKISWNGPSDFGASISYDFIREYTRRTVDSMGTTLTDVTGETLSLLSYNNSGETLQGSFSFPLGERTKGTYSEIYDLEENETAQRTFTLKRDLHCWVGLLQYIRDEQSEDKAQTFQFALYLKKFPKFGFGAEASVAREAQADEDERTRATDTGVFTY